MLDVAATIVDWGESRHVHGNRDPENPGRVEGFVRIRTADGDDFWATVAPEVLDLLVPSRRVTAEIEDIARQAADGEMLPPDGREGDDM